LGFGALGLGASEPQMVKIVHVILGDSSRRKSPPYGTHPHETDFYFG
jgi:hypothetical protein